MTCWCVISFRWYRITAVHKCCTFRLKRKNLLSHTPDACCPLLAMRSIQLMTGEPRSRYSALQFLGESMAYVSNPVSYWASRTMLLTLEMQIYHVGVSACNHYLQNCGPVWKKCFSWTELCYLLMAFGLLAVVCCYRKISHHNVHCQL